MRPGAKPRSSSGTSTRSGRALVFGSCIREPGHTARHRPAGYRYEGSGSAGCRGVPRNEAWPLMTPAEYDQLSERLRTRLEGDARVLALVALGSTAFPERRDTYSDHDFWVVVTP